MCLYRARACVCIFLYVCIQYLIWFQPNISVFSVVNLICLEQRHRIRRRLKNLYHFIINVYYRHYCMITVQRIYIYLCRFSIQNYLYIYICLMSTGMYSIMANRQLYLALLRLSFVLSLTNLLIVPSSDFFLLTNISRNLLKWLKTVNSFKLKRRNYIVRFRSERLCRKYLMGIIHLRVLLKFIC